MKAKILLLAAALWSFATQAAEPALMHSAEAPAAADMLVVDEAPARAYSDADFSEWETYGMVYVYSNFDINGFLEGYRHDGEEAPNAVKEHYAEALVRHLKADPDVIQLLIPGFLNLANVSITLDPVTMMMSMDRTTTNLPVYEELKSAFGTEALTLSCAQISYTPSLCRLIFSNIFLEVREAYGIPFTVTVTLPGTPANMRMGYSCETAPAGHSTHAYDEFAIDLTGIDHIKYYTTSGSFTINDLRACLTGELNTVQTNSRIYVGYSEGAATYNVWSLCFDENDKYLGFYYVISIQSNRAPEGQWEEVGKAIWHHPYSDSYVVHIYNDDNEYVGAEEVVFPEEAMQWEVTMERRTDSDREIYRFVNPYGAGCALNETWSNLMDRMYGIGYWSNLYDENDNYWLVVEMPAAGGNDFVVPSRPTGATIAHFINTWFPTEYESVTFEDNKLRLYAPHYLDRELLIELPDMGGLEAPVVNISAPIEYFNLQGIRVDNPSEGIYIRRQGDRIEKVRL